MSPLVRRAGVVTLADGTELVWSVADGRRGRRWRALTNRRGTLVGSLLLEVDVDGRPERIELATTSGLLTLHPERDGELHGNAIAGDGVRHFTLPWSSEHELEGEPLPVTGAVTALRVGRRLPPGEGTDVPVVVVGDDLTVREAMRRYRRLDATTWQVDGDDATRVLVVDDRGMPVWETLAEPSTGVGDWPLELDPRD